MRVNSTQCIIRLDETTPVKQKITMGGNSILFIIQQTKQTRVKVKTKHAIIYINDVLSLNNS